MPARGERAALRGCNVENVGYPVSQCAEATAIGAMVAAGDREIAEVVVLTERAEPCSPCGRCRQQLAEFAGPGARIHLCGPEGLRLTTTLGELLPMAFGPGGARCPDASRLALAPELIRRKRDGATLSEAEIAGRRPGSSTGP